MTTTLTLADFLLARIAEDEAVARAVNTGRWYPWDDSNGELSLALSGIRASAASHVARQNPDRVLRRCKADRLVVALHKAEVMGGVDDCGYACRNAVCPTLALIALPFADHPDYRDEWRP